MRSCIALSESRDGGRVGTTQDEQEKSCGGGVSMQGH